MSSTAIFFLTLCCLVSLSNSFSRVALVSIRSRFTIEKLQQGAIVVSEERCIRPGVRTFMVPEFASDEVKNNGRKTNDSTPILQTFRDAELQGLKLMQQKRHIEALEIFQKGLKLPGSKMDVVRTQSISGPSPVGGASGGKSSQVVQTLDEFEFQAAYYNIACAYSCLGEEENALANLQKSFEYGFDNFKNCVADPDLQAIQGSAAFKNLMESFAPKKGFFNPFQRFL